jgi:hypothetical protein
MDNENCYIVKVAVPQERAYLVVRAVQRPDPRTTSALNSATEAANAYAARLRDESQ